MANSKEVEKASHKVLQELENMTEEEIKREFKNHKKSEWYDIIYKIFEERLKTT